ncbi:MAG: alpha/beta hydrolase [Sphingomonadaceae bacterium]
MAVPFVRPDVAMFLSYINTVPGPKLHELEAPAARQTMHVLHAIADVEVGPLAVIRDLAISAPHGTIGARLYDARETRDPGPVMVFYHGGGFVIGDLDTHQSYCAEVARTLDIPVIAIDYRRAPEHPWPAAPDDCEAATRWIATSPPELGRTVTGIVPSGDSAGGNLTIVTTTALRDTPAAVPVIAQFPIYPVVDDSPDWPSHAEHGEGKLLTFDSMEYFSTAYAAEPGHPRAFPLKADHRGMPPTLVMTAGLDPLRDQGRAYVGALAAAGVPVTFREAVGNIHGFITLRKAIASGQADIAGALAVLKRIIAEAARQL